MTIEVLKQRLMLQWTINGDSAEVLAEQRRMEDEGWRVYESWLASGRLRVTLTKEVDGDE